MNDSTGSTAPLEERRKQVLVIDDNSDILEIISRTLHGTEFQVIGAPDGRVGIQIAKEHRPDIILLDIEMPVFDGFMTAKVIKRVRETKDIPIIFLSSRNAKQDIHSAIQAGGSDYIVKPFNPHDLIARLRKTINMLELEERRLRFQKERSTSSAPLPVEKGEGEHIPEQAIQSFVRHGDIIVCPLITPTLDINNLHIYRGLFSNLIIDGIVKIVFDAETIEKIDGSGLGLLVSVHEALKSYSGSLRIVLPQSGVFEQVSYMKLNDLFDCFDSVQAAVESFSENTHEDTQTTDSHHHDMCMVCGKVSDNDSRYCKYCGSNLVISKGIKTLDVIRGVMSPKVAQEQGVNQAENDNTSPGSIIDEALPSEFLVEFSNKTVTVQYQATLADTTRLVTNSEIGVRAPFMSDEPIPLHKGMAVTMRAVHAGSTMTYATSITGIDVVKGNMYVRYTDEAKILLSQKNFSVAPLHPITILITCPALNYDGGVLEAKMLELGRTRMVLFSDRDIPEKECLSVSFQLSGVVTISSPLAVATKKRKEKYLYDIEFALIDEREQSNLIQYMYKRQIELAKAL